MRRVDAVGHQLPAVRFPASGFVSYQQRTPYDSHARFAVATQYPQPGVIQFVGYPDPGCGINEPEVSSRFEFGPNEPKSQPSLFDAGSAQQVLGNRVGAMRRRELAHVSANALPGMFFRCPRGRLKTARSIFGSVALETNLRWNGSS